MQLRTVLLVYNIYDRDGTGQDFCSPARPEVIRNRPARTVYAKPHIIFRTSPWPV